MAVYYMPDPDDGWLKKLYTWITTGKRFRPSFPRTVQFQTLWSCNAKCIFCPHCHNSDEIPRGYMEDSLITKIIDECSKHMVGRINPYLTNEPLLDKRMPDILKSIKQKARFPIKTKINSNAALLTEDVSRRLIDSKLDYLWISVNGYSPETYRKSMSLDFDTTMRNIDTFLNLKKQMGKKRPKVSVTTLCTSIVEPEMEKAHAYWAERDVTFRVHSVDNRTGEDVTKDLRPDSAEHTIKRNCDLFLKQAYIVENGDMILCCHDWKQSVVVGNVARTSIEEVWNSNHFKKLIYEYYEEKFDNIEICRYCG